MKNVSIKPIERPVRASVTVPGSKSYTIRALVLAALTRGAVRIERPLLSDDTEAMLACLKKLGVKLRRREGVIEVIGDVLGLPGTASTLDVNQSGLSMRCLLALCTTIPGAQTLSGKPSLNQRPIGELVDALRQLGAAVEYLERSGFPPVRVTSSTLRPGTVTMKGNTSSQYLSALLQVTPLINGELTVKIQGQQISKSYIDMTIDTMEAFGVKIENDDYRTYHVAGGQHYQLDRYGVEGDFSSACYFWAIAALTGSTIEVTNLNPRSKQADRRFLDVLTQMGAAVAFGPSSITVTGAGVKSVDVNMEDCPDQAMTLAVLVAFAQGTTTITGVASLRVKETERVLAVETELQKMGVRCHSTSDTLIIEGGNPSPATIDTYNDHRMAMSFAVAGTALAGMIINDPSVVTKTFPGFWKELASIVNAGDNIVLVGMRGSGKSTVGQLLAARLGKTFVDADSLIAAKAGMSIPEIVATHGWSHFRDLEAGVIEVVSIRRGLVLAAGGGAALRPSNVKALRRHGRLVLLTAPAAILAGRIKDDLNRPALTVLATLRAELSELWNQRKSSYQSCADITVATENRTPEGVVETIITHLDKEAA